MVILRLFDLLASLILMSLIIIIAIPFSGLKNAFLQLDRTIGTRTMIAEFIEIAVMRNLDDAMRWLQTHPQGER